jgi:CheY-like chemotaxis protein
LTLLDYKMPATNGVELYRHLKQEGAETVGVVVTAFALCETINDAIKAGMRQVMSNPVNFGRKVWIIKEVAGRA